MILTCPECATGYFVQDDQIQASGRAVRCAACGHRWTAHPERPLDLVASEGGGALAREPGDEASSETGAALTGDDLPRAFRTRAEEEKRNRQAAISGALWAGVAIVVALVLGVVIVFRENVVRAWPQTASAYAAVGLAVNPTGLVIENVQREPSLEEGHPTLVVSGTIRNIVGRAVLAPPLRISLLNAQGKRVAGQITSFADPHIPAGATRSFRTSIPDPPFSAVTLQVDFAIGAQATAGHMESTPAASPQASSISLRGPASDMPTPAVNATPLPAGPAFAPTTEQPVPAPAPAAAPAARACRREQRTGRAMTFAASNLEILLSEAEVNARVAELAGALAPRVADDAVAVCLLTGGLWFASDITRALARLGKHVAFDALWLASYGDNRTSRGRCQVRADLQRPMAGRQALVLDDVVDTGLSLSEAARLVRDAGAREVITCVFARKPWPTPRALEPDFAAWDAPPRYLVGYGMDAEGRLRGLPYIAAVD